MKAFEDALHLVSHCAERLPTLRAGHDRCLADKAVEPGFQIEVKNFMENLRSALDYCAAGLFDKYGNAEKPNPKVYFPYAEGGESRQTFREKTVQRCIPGLLASRPDIVKRLEDYQYFGNTGNWLALLAKLTNENKHNRLTPQVEKQYTAVEITATIPPGKTIEIDLRKIPLGGGPDSPLRAVAGSWAGLEFATTRVVVMPLLEGAVPNVRRVVEELASL
jgi:hypothetical protein